MMAACSGPGIYQYVRNLGQGAFGSVILAENADDGCLVAVKKIKRSQVQAYTESELLNHSMLRHPHIVKFEQVFLSPNNLNIVMEYVPDGSLLKVVQQNGHLSENMARWLFQQLVFAVDYCHRKGIANRDIKLDNLLLDMSIHGTPQYPILKVCDWGYAKSEYHQSLATSTVGTLAYMAPEVLCNSGVHYDGKRADIWSCGVVLYTMLVGKMPFKRFLTEAPGQMSMMLLKEMQQQQFPLPSYLTPEATDLLRRLLNPNADQRISIAAMVEHPWFCQNLPSNTIAMNDAYVKLPRNCAQSIEEIKYIVARAVSSNHGCHHDQLHAYSAVAVTYQEMPTTPLEEEELPAEPLLGDTYSREYANAQSACCK